MTIKTHDAQEEIANNKDPVDTPFEAEINSKTIGPIDTAAEIKRFLEDQRKRGADDISDNPEDTPTPHP